MGELNVGIERPTRNFINGRFLKGHVPFNKGKKWKDYMGGRKIKKILKGLSIGRKGNPNIAGSNAKKVVAVKNGKLIAVYASSNDAERKTGICSRNIRSCCSGKRKHAGGYRWFWENDNSWCDLINYGKF